MSGERPFARCRRATGLSLQSAAIRLRISERYLRSLELGRVPLSQRIAGKMSAEYGASVNELTRPTATR